MTQESERVFQGAFFSSENGNITLGRIAVDEHGESLVGERRLLENLVSESSLVSKALIAKYQELTEAMKGGASSKFRDKLWEEINQLRVDDHQASERVTDSLRQQHERIRQRVAEVQNERLFPSSFER